MDSTKVHMYVLEVRVGAVSNTYFILVEQVKLSVIEVDTVCHVCLWGGKRER